MTFPGPDLPDHLFLMSDGCMWLSAKCPPLQTPPHTFHIAHFEICAAVTTCNSGSCLFSRLPLCFPAHHRSASQVHLHTPSAVSSDEGPYSKGSKESGTTDQSHPSHRRSFSGKMTPCKSVLLLLPDSCYTAQLVYVLTKRSHTV